MELNAKTIMNRLQKETELLKPITPENSKKLKTVLVGMLSDLQQVCMDNEIDVMLAYGSALGAVRHKGFIPWDDDLDVYMSRSDWNKFKSIFKSLMGDKYELEGPNANENAPKQTFAKIYLKGTDLTDIYDLNTPYLHGIYIDIFILDNLAGHSIIRKIDAKVSEILKFIINSQTYYEYPNPLIEKFMKMKASTHLYLNFRKFLGFMISFKSHTFWCNWFDKFFSRHKKTSSGLTQFSWSREVFDRSVYYPCSEGDFEGLKVKLPGNVHEYLRKSYGDDYMELPPMEKREDHMIINLDFGKC